VSNASQYHEIYRRLSDAIARDNASVMTELIDTDTFLAMLPGIEEPLSFTQFLIELNRQRKMFSDFGHDVKVKDSIADDNRLGVSYSMVVTNDGPLANRDGRAIMPGTGKKIVVNSMDTLTFNSNNKIVHLVVVSDRMGTLKQLI
jgi:hypothetical protein